MTPETGFFRLSWHYRWIILPAVWFAVTYLVVDILRQYAAGMLTGQEVAYPALLVDLPVVFFCFLLWYKWLTMPLSVVIESSGRLILRGMFRRTEIAIADIERVERRLLWEKIHTQRGNFFIGNLMENNDAIVPALKAHNPEIEVQSRG